MIDEGAESAVLAIHQHVRPDQGKLRERDIEYVELPGDTTDRATPVERFQAGEVPLFLISLKAGGTA